jgi:hypothetical protein
MAQSLPSRWTTATVTARDREVIMARLKGLEPAAAGWFARLVYWLTRRKVAKLTGKSLLIEPVTITAHHTRLLRAVGEMEVGQAAARSVPARLKTLASIYAATLIGCPY